MTVSFSRGLRAAAAGAVSAALLSAGAAGAVAAAPSPGTHSASISVKASPTTVKAGHMVRFTGRTSGLRPGATLVLQQDKNGKWVPLHSNTKVKKGNAYLLAARPSVKGTLHYRVASGATHSSTVNVTVQ
ncbi:hypothetical protein [Streptomyces tropicalis]|uniref:Secreted protein n=1 Tax=Streptomyces tropicalis TaxID=3034234 RepID=A0ABT6A9R4_9ACTN|nr:hypothetical protein [Streptomyces tropicalis]MDF3301391.1 hypothetical protein [Streptomyces tropicalis]